MQTVTNPEVSIDRGEIPSMLATLCSYEAWLGPYHPQTMHLLAQVGIAYLHIGDAGHALPFLESAVRDLGNHLRPDHALRLHALAALRDLFVAERDFDRARAAQSELLRCKILSLGNDHPETVAARAALAAILLQDTAGDPDRQV